MEVRNAEDQGHPLLYWLHKKFEASLVSKKKEEKKKRVGIPLKTY